MTGFIYILHFDQYRHHARHYTGSSIRLLERLHNHAAGQGAAITRALWEHDEHWTLAAIYVPRTEEHDIRHIETEIKRRHDGPAYCPICDRDGPNPPGCIQYPHPPITSRQLRQPLTQLSLLALLGLEDIPRRNDDDAEDLFR